MITKKGNNILFGLFTLGYILGVAIGSILTVIWIRKGRKMNKTEFLNDLILTYEECDSECGECLLANYITIFDNEYLLCDVIQTAYQKGVLSFCKLNKIDLNKAEVKDK